MILFWFTNSNKDFINYQESKGLLIPGAIKLMFLIHPMVQLSATLFALYALLLGINWFRRFHLKQKIMFNWQHHVRFGSIALLLWLLGLIVGLLVAKQYWHGVLITGSHGDRLFFILPLIVAGLFSGWYMDKRKKQRVFLPLIHGGINVVLIILVLLQTLSGWQVYKAFVLGL